MRATAKTSADAAQAASSTPGQVIDLSFATLSLRPDGILVTEGKPNAVITYNDAVDMVRQRAILAGGIKRPQIVYMRSVKSIERAARAYFGGAESTKTLSAVALVTNSPIGRVIANFMLGLNRPPVPIQAFTEEQTAIIWLKDFLHDR